MSLDTIVAKAMHKDPDRRYEGAGPLAEDIDRLLRGLPVRARGDSWRYRTWKFIGRNRLAVTAACLVIGTLIAGVIVSGTFAVRAARERAEAERQTAIAEATNRFLNEDVLAAVSPANLGRDTTLEEAFDVAAASLVGRFDDAPLVEADIRGTMTTVYLHLGDYDAAESHATRRLTLLTEVIGRTDPRTSAAMTALASVRLYQNRQEEASALLAEAVSIQEETLPPEDRQRIETLGELASSLVLAHRYAEAESVFGVATEGAADALGPDDESTLTILHNLAWLYRRTDRPDESIALRKEVLAAQRRSLGPTHPQTFASEASLATTYMHVGRWADADSLLSGSLARAERIFGRTHPRVLAALGSLAQTRNAAGRALTPVGSRWICSPGARRSASPMAPAYSRRCVRCAGRVAWNVASRTRSLTDGEGSPSSSRPPARPRSPWPSGGWTSATR